MIYKHIEISDKTTVNKFICIYNYKDIKGGVLKQIISDSNIKCIQISKNLPDKALMVINDILEKRPDLMLRIYGMRGDAPFDISRLKIVKKLTKLTLEILNKPGYKRFENLPFLVNLKTIDTLYLSVYGKENLDFFKDLLFIRHFYLNGEKGALHLPHEFINSENLNSIRLGGTAVSLLKEIKANKSIRKLVLFQTKMEDFSFINEMQLDELCFINCDLINTCQIEANNHISKLIIADSKYDNSFWERFTNLKSFDGPISQMQLDQFEL